MIRRRVSLALVLASLVLPAVASDQPRAVPDTPADFKLSGEQHWVVVSVRADGEAAIGLARELTWENQQVQVARTRDGKYAVLVGPGPKLTDAELKSRFEGRGAAGDTAQLSRGEEFVARAWEFKDGRAARSVMREGKPVAASTGAVAMTARVVRAAMKKSDELYALVVEGSEGGQPAFRLRIPGVYRPDPTARLTWVKLEGETPQAVIGLYTGGAHCCVQQQLATKGADGKWKTLSGAKLDGDYGYTFEDLDGDGTSEMLSGDNRFLYQFASYAESRMPAKIEKLVGAKIVDVSRDPKYRRYHVQYLAAMEAGADEEAWKTSGFLSGWVAQKALVGERADGIARARKLFDKGDEPDFEQCMTNRYPLDKCPEKQKKLVPFADALAKFLDENGYK